MSLLKQLLNEIGGVTGGGSVAAYSGSLFGGGTIPEKKNKNMIRRVSLLKPEFKNPLKDTKQGWHKVDNKFTKIKESLQLASDESNFDANEVLSKIDSAKRKADNYKDTVAFGLEDSDGNIVKVYVGRDQSEAFEKEIQQLLNSDNDEFNYSDFNSDEDKDSEEDGMEIAELLWKLKDKYDLVDVEWEQLPEDEEEMQELSGDEEGDLSGEEGIGDEEGDLPGEEGMGDEEGDMMPDIDAGGEEDTAATALQQVIDMLKADAEAKMAEANARQAEAKAKQAEYAAKAAEAKIRQEEETLEMEDYYNSRKQETDEAKRLAKLAKYKHDKAKETQQSNPLDVEFSPEEEEEIEDFDVCERKRPAISVDELTNLLLSRVKQQ